MKKYSQKKENQYKKIMELLQQENSLKTIQNTNVNGLDINILFFQKIISIIFLMI